MIDRYRQPDAKPFRLQGRIPKPLREWAADHRVVVGGSRPGRWDPSNAPFSAAPMDDVGRIGVEAVVVVAPTQLMKTELAVSAILHCIVHGNDALLFEPDVSLSAAFVTERVRPALLAMGEDVAISGGVDSDRLKKRDTTSTLRVKGGGTLTAVTPQMKTGKSARTARLVVVDELDKCGDPSLYLAARSRVTTAQDLASVLMVSTPTEDRHGTIWRAYEGGSRGEWHGRCVHCRELTPVTWDRVKIEKDKRGRWKPRTAVMYCKACGEPWNERARLTSVAAGEYVHREPGNPVRSYWVPGPAHLWRRVKDIARLGAEALRAALDESDWESYRAFVNEFIAEPWTDEYEGLSARRLAGATWESEIEGLGVLDPRASLVVVGADIGAHSIHAEWLAVGFDEDNDRVLSWGLGYHVFGGAADDDIEDPALWDEFLKACDEWTWHDPVMDATVRADRVFVDVGYRPELVRSWCEHRYREDAPNPPRPPFGARILPIRGRGPVIKSPHPLDLLAGRQQKAARMRKPATVYADVNAIKDVAYESLLGDKRLPPDVEPANKWPANGKCGYDARWFDEMAAEVRTWVRNPKGQVSIQWKERKGREKGNEAWDCRIYAMAAAMMEVGPPTPLIDGLRVLHQRRKTRGKGKG